jgi:hypothetical protein
VNGGVRGRGEMRYTCSVKSTIPTREDEKGEGERERERVRTEGNAGG